MTDFNWIIKNQSTTSRARTGIISTPHGEIETPAFIVMGLGAVILLIYGIISLSEVRGVFFGRRGRYGLNTTIIFVVALTIAIIGNITVYLTITRTNPPNWMRIDTTATKQFLLEERVVNILNNMKEPIHITAFFTEDTTQDIAASRFTEDLLNEFLSVENEEYKIKKQLFKDLKQIITAKDIIKLHKLEDEFHKKLIREYRAKKENNKSSDE